MFYILAVFNVFIAGVAQMLLKTAASKKYNSKFKEYFNPWVICGNLVLGLVLLSNIYALSNGVLLKEQSIIDSLGYLFVPLLSYLFFNEPLNAKKLTSISIILLGVVIFFCGTF